MVAVYIVVSIIGYLLGSISFSIIFSKKIAGFDVREKGSKNAGTTNVLRTVGKKAAILTLICDIIKGVLAVSIALIAGMIWKDLDVTTLKYVAGLMAIIGHTFPIYFGFRGGKGVATSLGVLLITNWKVGIICLIFAIILITLTKMVSVGSITTAILYPILTIFVPSEKSLGAIILSILIALLVVYNHRANIKRLREGKENKLSFSNK